MDLAGPIAIEAVGGLPDRCHNRLLELGGHRAAIVRDAQDAAAAWPSRRRGRRARCGQRGRSMLDRLTANLLDLCTRSAGSAGSVQQPDTGTPSLRPSRYRPRTCGRGSAAGATMGVAGRSGRGRSDATSRAGWITGPGPVGRACSRHRTDPDRLRPGRAHRASTGDGRGETLGTFELRVDGLSVTTWSGQRGVSVLRYLLSRRRHSRPRDELLAEFWPEVAPPAARNRLQVAVSGVRRALLDVTNLYVIEYAEGGYRINRSSGRDGCQPLRGGAVESPRCRACGRRARCTCRVPGGHRVLPRRLRRRCAVRAVDAVAP